jgi:hypothetical protein
MPGDCLICFCNEPNVIRCGKENCSYVYCFDCSERLIEHSDKETVIPSCACGEPLYDSQIIKISKDCVSIYRKLLYRCLYNTEKGFFDIRKNTKIIISKLQSERLKFLESFPTCISLAIKYTCQNKKNKIRREYLDKVEKSVGNKCHDIFCNGMLDVTKRCKICQVKYCGDCEEALEGETHICDKNILDSKKKGKKCSDVYCFGVLDKDNSCIVCDVKYCTECEEAKEQNHTCDKDVLESINMIKKHVKCPICNIPVSKSEGCNNMTCPICKTNFCFRTGDIIIPGNHSDLTIKLVKYNVTELFQEEITRDYNEVIVSKIDRFFEIKNKRGTKYEDIMIRIEKGDVNLGPIYEKYRRCLNRNIQCNEVFKLILKRHEMKSLDEEFIDSKLKLIS